MYSRENCSNIITNAIIRAVNQVRKAVLTQSLIPLEYLYAAMALPFSLKGGCLFSIDLQPDLNVGIHIASSCSDDGGCFRLEAK